MKIIILESQYKRLFEQDEEKILTLPSLKYFGGSWDNLSNFLKKKGNPPYIIDDDLNLYGSSMESLGNLTSVDGYLNLYGTPIKSLGNLQSVGGYLSLANSPIKSLGNLTSVGSDLYLYNTPIKSLGNLTSVGGALYLNNTPISKKYSEQEIRQMVNVDGNLYF